MPKYSKNESNNRIYFNIAERKFNIELGIF